MAFTAVSDAASVATEVFPAVATIGTVTSSYVDMGAYESGQWVVRVGTLGTASTITPVINQAVNTSGGSAKAVTFLSAVTIAPITTANTESIFNVNGQIMDANNGFRYTNCVVTLASASSVIGISFEGVPQSTPPYQSSAGVASFQLQVLK
jgi:hypothetical protein